MAETRMSTANKTQFDINRRKILASQSICGICGKPVDKSIKYPNPMSATVDHIVPIARGGHPSDIDNLQLAHWACNRAKWDNITWPKDQPLESNRNLPLSCNWRELKIAANGGEN